MILIEKILTLLEPLMVLAVLVAFAKSRYYKRLHAMRNFLFFRFISATILVAIINVPHFIRVTETEIDYTYYYAYWFAYLTSAVLIFFVLREVYSELMHPLPEIRRLGMIAFRWIMVISGVMGVIIAVSSEITPNDSFPSLLMYVSELCVRSVSILELCLLAFLTLTVRNLGRSFRSPLFGIALGFGIQASADFVITAISQWKHVPIWSLPELILEILTTLVLVTWVTYFLLPERQEEQAVAIVPAQSPLIRWNDVAQALGHSTPRVAMGGSTGFFLQDVERVVDRVLARNGHLDAANSATKVS